MSGKKIVDVVAAVILRPDGRFLLAQRPEGQALRRLLGVSGRQGGKPGNPLPTH